MSHYVSVTTLPPQGEKLQLAKFTSWRFILMLTAIAGIAFSIFFFLSPGETSNSYAFSYLFALEVFFTIAAGATFWVLLHNASNSSWGVAIRRIPELMTQLFVPLFILALPLFTPLVPLSKKPEFMGKIWEWVGIHQQVMEHPPINTSTLAEGLAATHDTTLLYKKLPYLHTGIGGIIPGMDVRMAIFFLVLFALGTKLLGYSLSQDKTGAVQPTYSARRFSCGMLPVFAVCSTFAGIDWIMSMNYTWFSTMFGVNIFAGSALASMAAVILIVGTLVKTGHLKHIVTPEHYHLMGKLMHAFIIFWAYISFSQFFLIWYANIPEETQFYAIRNTNGWWFLSLALVFLHFAVPFIFLLKRNSKRNLNAVMAVAAFVIFVHILELYWMIIPERGRALYDFTSAPTSGAFLRDLAFDAIALITFASTCGYFMIRLLSKHSLYPCGDPRLEESVNVVS
jgi:hypothetical protein